MPRITLKNCSAGNCSVASAGHRLTAGAWSWLVCDLRHPSSGNWICQLPVSPEWTPGGTCFSAAIQNLAQVYVFVGAGVLAAKEVGILQVQEACPFVLRSPEEWGHVHWGITTLRFPSCPHSLPVSLTTATAFFIFNYPKPKTSLEFNSLRPVTTSLPNKPRHDWTLAVQTASVELKPP